MAHALKTKSPVEFAAERRRRTAAERARGMLAHLTSSGSMADALIIERRREARAEGQAEKQAAQAKRRSAER
jgi:hypothetical protein